MPVPATFIPGNVDASVQGDFIDTIFNGQIIYLQGLLSLAKDRWSLFSGS